MPKFLKVNDHIIHYSYREGVAVRNGGAGTKPIVFANSLGTDFRIWDGVIDLLPSDIPILCVDKRGHGLSALGPITIPTLASDIAGIMDHLGLSGATICGVSVGGLIAQSLCGSRPDLVIAAIFSNTSFVVGSAESWNPRIAAVRDSGIAPMSDVILERWFSKHYEAAHPTEYAGYKMMLERTPAEGYARVCEAIRDTNFEAQCEKIVQKTICIAGAEDSATPPEVVEKLANALPNSEFRVLSGVGHLPCIEAPQKIVDALADLDAF